MKILYALNEKAKERLMSDGHRYVGEDEIVLKGEKVNVFIFMSTRNNYNYSSDDNVIVASSEIRFI